MNKLKQLQIFASREEGVDLELATIESPIISSSVHVVTEPQTEAENAGPSCRPRPKFSIAECIPRRCSCFNVLDCANDAWTVTSSILDIFTDILVAMEFYKNDHMAFFWCSLAIFLAAQLAYAFLFTGTWAATHTNLGKVCVFVSVLPLGQLIPIFAWLESFHFEVVDAFLEKLSLTPTGKLKGGLEAADATRNSDSLWSFIQKKYTAHAGFLAEAFVEAIPQGILQLVAILTLDDSSGVNVLSILMSISVVASKGYLVAFSLHRPTLVFNFLTISADAFNLFAAATWLFVVVDNHRSAMEDGTEDSSAGSGDGDDEPSNSSSPNPLSSHPAYVWPLLVGLGSGVVGTFFAVLFMVCDDHLKVLYPIVYGAVLGSDESVAFDLYAVRFVAWALSLLPLAVAYVTSKLSTLPVLLFHSLDPEHALHAQFYRPLFQFLRGFVGRDHAPSSSSSFCCFSSASVPTTNTTTIKNSTNTSNNNSSSSSNSTNTSNNNSSSSSNSTNTSNNNSSSSSNSTNTSNNNSSSSSNSTNTSNIKNSSSSSNSSSGSTTGPHEVHPLRHASHYHDRTRLGALDRQLRLHVANRLLLEARLHTPRLEKLLEKQRLQEEEDDHEEKDGEKEPRTKKGSKSRAKARAHGGGGGGGGGGGERKDRSGGGESTESSNGCKGSSNAAAKEKEAAAAVKTWWRSLDTTESTLTAQDLEERNRKAAQAILARQRAKAGLGPAGSGQDDVTMLPGWSDSPDSGGETKKGESDELLALRVAAERLGVASFNSRSEILKHFFAARAPAGTDGGSGGGGGGGENGCAENGFGGGSGGGVGTEGGGSEGGSGGRSGFNGVWARLAEEAAMAWDPDDMRWFLLRNRRFVPLGAPYLHTRGAWTPQRSAAALHRLSTRLRWTAACSGPRCCPFSWCGGGRRTRVNPETGAAEEFVPGRGSWSRRAAGALRVALRVLGLLSLALGGLAACAFVPASLAFVAVSLAFPVTQLPRCLPSDDHDSAGGGGGGGGGSGGGSGSGGALLLPCVLSWGYLACLAALAALAPWVWRFQRLRAALRDCKGFPEGVYKRGFVADMYARYAAALGRVDAMRTVHAKVGRFNAIEVFSYLEESNRDTAYK